MGRVDRLAYPCIWDRSGAALSTKGFCRIVSIRYQWLMDVSVLTCTRRGTRDRTAGS